MRKKKKKKKKEYKKVQKVKSEIMFGNFTSLPPSARALISSSVNSDVEIPLRR
jgi:hypothetical protein